MHKLIISTSLILAFATSSFASSRVDDVIFQSTSEQISQISELERKLNIGKRELTIIEAQLSEAKKISDKQKKAISFRNKSALVAVASAVSLAGSFVLQANRFKVFKKSGKMFTHPGENETLLAIIGLVGFPVATIGAGAAEIMVLLNQSEVVAVEENIKILLASIDSKKAELKREKGLLCKQDPRHETCYSLN